jgi:hypothetical protein
MPALLIEEQICLYNLKNVPVFSPNLFFHFAKAYSFEKFDGVLYLDLYVHLPNRQSMPKEILQILIGSGAALD